MRRLFPALLCAALAAPAAAVETVAELQAWATGPASFLLTESERAGLAGIDGDAAAQRFVDLFWARRDPDLVTRDNQALFDFEARVMAADSEFREGDGRGAMSPRGRVLILLGVPTRHARMPIVDYLSQLYGAPPPQAVSSDPEAWLDWYGVSFNLARGVAELWAYSRTELPSVLASATEAEELVFAFFDVEGDGSFRLQGGIRRSQPSQKLLDAAPAALVLHPQMETPPVYPLEAGGLAATASQLAALDGDGERWPEGASALVVQGVAAADRLPLWLSVTLPEAVAAIDTAAGRLVLADGTVVGSFQRAVTGRPTAGGTAYELALPAPGAAARLELVLLAGEQAVATRRLDVDAGAGGAPFLSQVFAGAEVVDARDAAAGDPFVFGGYHLLPRPDGGYRGSDTLNLFCLAALPAHEQASVEASVRMRWYVDGKPAPSAPAQTVVMAAAGPGVYAWGTQLPLASMTPGRSYSLKLQVAVADGELERTTTIPISIDQQ